MSMRTTLKCRYCGKPAKLIRESRPGELKGGRIWFCPICMAQVPARSWDNEPKGIIASEELRLAHYRLFIEIEKKKVTGTSLQSVLGWLSGQIGMPLDRIEYMDEEQTGKALEVMQGIQKGEQPWRGIMTSRSRHLIYARYSDVWPRWNH